MDLSKYGKASAPTIRQRVYGESVGPQGPIARRGDCRTAQATDFVFELHWNSGKITKQIVRAVSAQSAMRQLRDGCIGLVRFKLCAQRGTCYPY